MFFFVSFSYYTGTHRFIVFPSAPFLFVETINDFKSGFRAPFLLAAVRTAYAGKSRIRHLYTGITRNEIQLLLVRRNERGKRRKKYYWTTLNGETASRITISIPCNVIVVLSIHDIFYMTV